MLLGLASTGQFVIQAATIAATTLQPSCKPLPNSPNWPSEVQWQALNDSISGNLIVPYPFGAVCQTLSDAYNDTSCTFLKSQWTNSSWQESNGWTSMYHDDTCIPDSRAPCSTAGYPAYVIEARDVADVQAGVKFANDTGVRLIVKGTGHDVPGRSAGAGALSIWTHHLRGVDVSMNDPLAVHEGAVASVKLGAGMTWGEIYAEIAKMNLTVVGGADPHVGIGGWVQGAGHSPLSSYYGLGADQVLEMEVVTADGKYRVINSTSEPELFWAMRGGGASTYAIMLSMTVKAYPQLSGVIHLFSYKTTASSTTFWTLAANFSSQLPRLSDLGAMGYYYIASDSGLYNQSTNGDVLGGFLFPNKTYAEVEAITKPLEASLQSSNWAADPIVVSSSSIAFDNFIAFWVNNNPADSVGSDIRFGSWLLDEPALTNVTRLADTLRDTTPADGVWIGHLVAGAGVRNARPVGGSNAVLPAWRQAYSHLIQVREWTPLNTTEQALATTAVRDLVQPGLRALAPKSGAYVNEADPSNPNWKNDYFGTNYDRLLQIKNQWDPQGVFWCKPCVGYDQWEIISIGNVTQDVHERGIGQDLVMLCRT